MDKVAAIYNVILKKEYMQVIEVTKCSIGKYEDGTFVDELGNKFYPFEKSSKLGIEQYFDLVDDVPKDIDINEFLNKKYEFLNEKFYIRMKDDHGEDRIVILPKKLVIASKEATATLYTRNNYVQELLSLPEDIRESIIREIAEIEYEDDADEIGIKRQTKKPRVVVNTKKMFDSVTKVIKSQDKQVADIVTTIARNYNDKSDRRKSHILISGPTGSGKTSIVEEVGRCLKVPFVIYDMTQVTIEGYKGNSINDILYRLISNADGDIDLAEMGIIALDEIDKKANSSGDFVSGVGVLNSVLKLMDGSIFDVEWQNNYKLEIDTSNITVISLGAFEGLVNKKPKIGFIDDVNSKKIYEVTPQDYIRYGMPPEYIGRKSLITQLNPLGKVDLENILLTSNNSPLLHMKKLFKQFGVTLEYDPSYIDEVIKQALLKKTGARALKSIIERSLLGVENEIYSGKKCSKVSINEETVHDSSRYVLIKK